MGRWNLAYQPRLWQVRCFSSNKTTLKLANWKIKLTEWPENVFTGFSNPILQTVTVLSVEQVANVVLLCQSISTTGPEMKTFEKFLTWLMTIFLQIVRVAMLQQEIFRDLNAIVLRTNLLFRVSSKLCLTL